MLTGRFRHVTNKRQLVLEVEYEGVSRESMYDCSTHSYIAWRSATPQDLADLILSSGLADKEVIRE